ncbi:MAG TPA: thermonuclease family protein [Pyrinomonadaceae bacterium]|nr:thermonuclease family protein [Pyrinomonadaceae bacterium]
MKHHIKLSALFILLLVFATNALAQSRPLVGRVVAISDGDTITVLDSNNTQHRIRLQGVDAPESKQAFGSRSKQNLSDLIFGKQVTVEWNARDRYQRILGKVMLDGRDINLEQLRSGMAWYYKAYERDVAAADRKPYSDAEAQARASKRGLWADSSPLAPWDFRRSERAGRTADGGNESRQTAATSQASASPSATGNIVGNRNSRKYHLPGCPGYNQTAEKNRVYFRTAQEAEAAGYTKAGNCNK